MFFANYFRFVEPSRARTRWTRNPGFLRVGGVEQKLVPLPVSLYILIIGWSISGVLRCTEHNSTHFGFLLWNFLSHLPAEFSHSSSLRYFPGARDSMSRAPCLSNSHSLSLCLFPLDLSEGISRLMSRHSRSLLSLLSERKRATSLQTCLMWNAHERRSEKYHQSTKMLTNFRTVCGVPGADIHSLATCFHVMVGRPPTGNNKIIHRHN